MPRNDRQLMWNRFRGRRNENFHYARCLRHPLIKCPSINFCRAYVDSGTVETQQYVRVLSNVFLGFPVH